MKQNQIKTKYPVTPITTDWNRECVLIVLKRVNAISLREINTCHKTKGKRNCSKYHILEGKVTYHKLMLQILGMTNYLY